MRNKGLPHLASSPQAASWRSSISLWELEERQYGVVSVRQLRQQLGYSPHRVLREVRAGRLHRLHRGVYAVGHRRISIRGTCLAAVLSCGPGALLSHGSAAWLWGISRGADRCRWP